MPRRPTRRTVLRSAAAAPFGLTGFLNTFGTAAEGGRAFRAGAATSNITPAIGGENIFFFHADVQGKDFLELKLGEKVEYISTVNERGPCARNVRVVG